MTFKKNKYLVIKEAVPKEIANFCYNYLLLKRQVAKTFFDTRYISTFTPEWGVWSDPQIAQHVFSLCGYSYGNFINENFTYYGKENRIKIISYIFLRKNI